MGKFLTSESAGSVDPARAPMPGQRREGASEFHTIQRLPDGPHVKLEYRRLALALVLSLLMHAMLLSLTFGGQGLWPGFGFPWQARRIEAPDLSVVIVPAQTAAREPPGTRIAEPVQETSAPSLASAPAHSVPHVSIRRRTEAKEEADPATVASPAMVANPATAANPARDLATSAAAAQMPLRADGSGGAPLPLIAAPPVIAMTPIDESTWVVTATPAPPAPAIAPTPSAPSPETVTPSLQQADNAAQARSEQEARERAIEPAKIELSKREAQRQAEQVERARQEAEREEVARQAAARVEAARVDVARQEAASVEAAARQEAARVEAAKAEAAKVEAAKVEAAKAEAAKVEAAKVEAAKVEAAKVEAAKTEAAKAEAARQEIAKAESAKAEAARQQAAKIDAAKVDEAAVREARLRAIGRQLDEEAARRDAAARQSPQSSSTRRYRLFGRTDPNAELILYAEAWARKIQLNMTFDMVREASKQPHTDPVVTVAIRSDGSVESVTFVKSSGVPALDDAIRRVVQSQAPYQEFPAGLAREFDVIEIRRTWYFDIAIRLY